MDKVFSDIHSTYAHELLGATPIMVDSDDVREARLEANDCPSYIALGKLLSYYLRYREAVIAYKKATELDAECYEAHRLLAGRYLTTLDLDNARKELYWCLDRTREKEDVLYLLGLSFYYSFDYENARRSFAEAFEYSDDELGIAIIYWHTIASVRLGATPLLLDGKYSTDMKIGHHAAYDKAIRVFKGLMNSDSLEIEIGKEESDLEYSMVMYGLMNYHLWNRDIEKARTCLSGILIRDSFWISFAFIAAINDNENKLLEGRL